MKTSQYMNPSKEAVLKARRWFYMNHLNCVKGAISGEYKVNDLPSYVQWQKKSAIDVITGKSNSLTLLQKAWYIQTGECVALLPK